jgi:hypothetical protein
LDAVGAREDFMKAGGLTILLTVGVLAGGTAWGAEFPGRIDFVVVDRDSGAVLMEGEEILESDARAVTKKTVYRDTAGVVVQNESCRFRSSDLRLESYFFENIVSGELVRVENDDGELRVEHRINRTAPIVKSSGRWSEGNAFSKTLGHYVVRNLARLMAGETLDFGLLIPSRGEAFAFRVAVETPAGTDRLEVVLEPQSWIVRRFVARMSFVVRTGSAPVVEVFRGPSPVDSEPYRGRQVEIRFRYPETASTRESGKQAS